MKKHGHILALGIAGLTGIIGIWFFVLFGAAILSGVNHKAVLFLIVCLVGLSVSAFVVSATREIKYLESVTR